MRTAERSVTNKTKDGYEVSKVIEPAQQTSTGLSGDRRIEVGKTNKTHIKLHLLSIVYR